MTESAGVPPHPFRMVAIQGAPAVMFQRAPTDFVSVQSAADADKALGDPGNTHHCGLCNDFFGTEAFKAHAPSCIKANAGRYEANAPREPRYAKSKRFRLIYGSNHGRPR